MKLRYLYVDRNGQLRKISRKKVEAIWEGKLGTEKLNVGTETELRLVSVLCNSRLIPKRLYVVRLPLIEGRFTIESMMTLQLFSQPEHVTPKEAFEHHTGGWPKTFFEQLAVVMDVPRAQLDLPVGIGGPLFLAAALRITPQEAVRYLR